MMNDCRDLIPLESNMLKNDPGAISHIMYMIDMDIFWHQKTLGAVLAELQRNHGEKVYEQDIEMKTRKKLLTSVMQVKP